MEHVHETLTTFFHCNMADSVFMTDDIDLATRDGAMDCSS